MSIAPAAHLPGDDRTTPPEATQARAAGRSAAWRPAGRAVLGAVLVTVAALGAFALADGGEGEPGTPVLVARGEIPVGHRLGHADVATVLIQADDPVAGWVVDAETPILGAVTLRPIRDGALLDRRDLRTGAAAATTASAGHHVLTLPVRGGRTPTDLRVGDRVTLLAYDERTGVIEVAAEDVAVLRFEGGDAGLGSGREARLTLGLERATDVVRAARGSHAVLTVVRTTSVIADAYPTASGLPHTSTADPVGDPAEVAP